MENVIKTPEQTIYTYNTVEEQTPDAETPPEVEDRGLPAMPPAVFEPEQDKPREHIRAPELHRNRTRITMAAAAVIGAAAGARLILENGADTFTNGIAQTLSGSFGGIFLPQAALGAMFLCAEFILGFFAAGDLLVWTAPFFCASGTVLRLAAGSPKLIPGLLICLVAVTVGAAYSADMSGMLMRLTRGGTVYLDSRPRRSYAVSFLGCLAAVVLGAILVGVLARS